ncbi:MAG: methylenetetrahydrofolate reductase [Coriobacteriia bacterium]|nr:methylenetetrahydrofolate reductase [Coriobacteriia bacterium]
MSLRETLESGRFAVTAEVGPPKGVDVERMLEVAERLRGRVTAINVTDNQSAVMRMSTLAACGLLQERGHETVFQVTCRDRNRLALQSDLLGVWALGVRNVLALTGDHPRAGDHAGACPVYDLESVQLLSAISSLNEGRDMAGGELSQAPELFAGAVVTPEAEPLEPQMRKFEKKVRAGARFFQTQAVYDVDRFEAFMERARGHGVPVLAGILLLRSARMAVFLNEKVPGVRVPEAFVRRLEESDKPAETGIRIAGEIIRALQPCCDGVHVMAVGAEHRVVDVLDAAGL